VFRCGQRTRSCGPCCAFRKQATWYRSQAQFVVSRIESDEAMPLLRAYLDVPRVEFGSGLPVWVGALTPAFLRSIRCSTHCGAFPLPDAEVTTSSP